MQIDAHVRFVQDWDDDLIQQWKNTKNESKCKSVCQRNEPEEPVLMMDGRTDVCVFILSLSCKQKSGNFDELSQRPQ